VRLPKNRLDVAGVERAVRPDRRLAHHEPVVLGHADPGRDVGVVVELGDDDLVAAAQGAGHGVGEQEVERRHVRSEGDLLRGAAGERGGGGPSGGDDLGRLTRGRERAAVIGHPVLQVRPHRRDHHVRDLGAAWAVEVGDPARQGGEAATDGLDVEHQSRQSGAHGTST
jgi:hypothetical protein